jgi:hypothetical protein
MNQVQPIFQEPGTFSCLGCVAAMIAGDPDLSRLAAYIGHEGEERPFRMTEIARYLAANSILLGGFADKPLVFRSRVSISWPSQYRSLLIVASKSGRGTHAVYWTGCEVVDPEPANQGKKLRHYVVLEWWPVIEVD